MVNLSALDSVFSALSDPVRRGIIQRLSAGRAPVSALAEPFSISPPAISRHLRVLERAGLVRRRKVGRIHEIELDPSRLQPAVDWLNLYRQHWEENLDSLAKYLESTAPESSSPLQSSKTANP